MCLKRRKRMSKKGNMSVFIYGKQKGSSRFVGNRKTRKITGKKK